MKQNISSIDIYTDGSCDTQYCIGAWVAILLWQDEKLYLSGVVMDTTHNRMELNAVIEAIAHVNQYFDPSVQINIYSDSQYVTGLPARREKLQSAAFLSKKGTHIQNYSMVENFFEYLAVNSVIFEKVKAHQKKTNTINYNIEADVLARRIVREQVKLLAL